MSLTFYFAPNSTASTVHWSLEELGIDYEPVQVDVMDDADKAAKLGPVNPNRQVPVLVHDGVPIFESAAIQIYLGETFGAERGLYPKPGPERGVAMAWLVWANVTLGGAVQRWLRNTDSRFDAAHRNAAAGAVAREEVDTLLGRLDAQLDGKKYILGDDISLVDFHLASFGQWFFHGCGIDPSPFPNIVAWAARCDARPALKKLMAAA